MKYNFSEVRVQKIGRAYNEAQAFFSNMVASGHEHCVLSCGHNELEITFFESTPEDVQEIDEKSVFFLSVKWKKDVLKCTHDDGTDFYWISFTFYFEH